VPVAKILLLLPASVNLRWYKGVPGALGLPSIAIHSPKWIYDFEDPLVQFPEAIFATGNCQQIIGHLRGIADA